MTTKLNLNYLSNFFHFDLADISKLCSGEKDPIFPAIKLGVRCTVPIIFISVTSEEETEKYNLPLDTNIAFNIADDDYLYVIVVMPGTKPSDNSLYPMYKLSGGAYNLFSHALSVCQQLDVEYGFEDNFCFQALRMLSLGLMEKKAAINTSDTEYKDDHKNLNKILGISEDKQKLFVSTACKRAFEKKDQSDAMASSLMFS